MTAQPVDVLAVMERTSEGLHGMADGCRSADLATAMRERAREFDAARAAVGELIEQYRALIELAESATRSDYEGTSMLDEMLAEIAPYRDTLARVQGDQS
jgi:hypothetical protein